MSRWLAALIVAALSAPPLLAQSRQPTSSSTPRGQGRALQARVGAGPARRGPADSPHRQLPRTHCHDGARQPRVPGAGDESAVRQQRSGGDFEEIALDIKSGIEFLRRQPGITQGRAVRHSGGGPATSFYQAVAEKGPVVLQGAEQARAVRQLAGRAAEGGRSRSSSMRIRASRSTGSAA